MEKTKVYALLYTENSDDRCGSEVEVFTDEQAARAEMQLLLSDMIRSTGIQQEMRPVTRRVAILAPGANRSLISECGIKFFCTVDDEWDLAVTESVPDDEVWNGVPVV